MGLTLEGVGNGEGITAKQNRLDVSSRVADRSFYISRDDGEAYIIASGDYIPITTLNTETGILYIKNTSTTKKLYIESIRTCGIATQKWKLYSGSTTGTLISGAVAGSSQNMNLTSNNVAGATVYKGADAVTLTNGTMIDHWINGIGHSVEFLNGGLILGVNDVIALTVETIATNSVCCRMIGYYE